jgi:5S rRNA maturation endonuclease (ribonuclease M5)
MGTGHEHLAKIHEKLREFEQAVIDREKFRPLVSKVTRQQEVDHARNLLVDTIVEIVTAERMKQQ